MMIWYFFLLCEELRFCEKGLEDISGVVWEPDFRVNTQAGGILGILDRLIKACETKDGTGRWGQGTC